VSDSGQSPQPVRLGAFALWFEPGGKCRQVQFDGHEPLLHEGGYELDMGGGRTFRVAGWDECFPTIQPFGGSPIMGDLIAAPPRLSQGAGWVEQAWDMPRFSARRRFAAQGQSSLVVTFEAVNHQAQPLEFLWASHAIFSTAGVRSLLLPDGRELSDLSLDGSTSKSFVVALGRPIVLARQADTISLSTDQPYWGLWLNRGGWPAAKPAGFGCVGLEPTNAASDAPAGARLQPAQTFRGTFTLSLQAAARSQ
jgi:hypothetical protein